MSSQVQIYNLALGNIGVSETVASITERSKSAIVCTQYWELARDTVLADFDWPFATQYATLALLAGTPTEWLYAYQYPTDCLRAIGLATPGNRNPVEGLRPKYHMAYGASGTILLTDQPNAILQYVTRIDDESRFPPLFVEALSWKLAAMIAMPLTATRTVTETASQMYEGTKQIAWAAALNESRTGDDYPSEFITVRGA